MKTLVFISLLASTFIGCSKDADPQTAYTATIFEKPASVSVGDSTLKAALVVDANNDTLLLANIPRSYEVGRQIHFNIRPLRAGDPVVVVALSPILPKEKFVKDLR